MKNLIIRTLSGVALVALFVGGILYAQWTLGLLLAVITVGGLWEFYALVRRQGGSPQIFLGMVAGLILFGLNYAFISDDIAILSADRLLFGYCLAFALLLIPTMFFCELWRKEPNPAANIGTTLAGVFYVALPCSLLCYFPIIATPVWTPMILIAYIAIVWGNDVFAYLVGMTFGRHRLFPRISPKKSWEGFFGGVAGAVLVGYLAAKYMHLPGTTVTWIGLALVTSITSVLGDLVESMLKRAADVKDSGDIIPGHGGILDRFDAMLLSAPFVFIYLLIA